SGKGYTTQVTVVINEMNDSK
nr:hypothetical protein [Tanacetum cinerariifolium]